MSLGNLYEDGRYLENNPTWHEEDSPWKARQILHILEKNHVRPKTLCEIGCGAGEILSRLSESLGDGVSLTGFEVSPQAFAICSRKAKKNLSFELADVFDVPRTFDVAMAIDVFEHVEDCFSFLRKMRAKATYKVFHIPLDLSLISILRPQHIIEARTGTGHIHYFTRETALALLRDTGYEIIDSFYTPSYELWKDESLTNKALNPMRRAIFGLNQDWAVRLLGGHSLLVLAK